MREYLRKGNDVFEIVDTVPLGYSIWNIGHNMPDGFCPSAGCVRNSPLKEHNASKRTR